MNDVLQGIPRLDMNLMPHPSVIRPNGISNCKMLGSAISYIVGVCLPCFALSKPTQFYPRSNFPRSWPSSGVCNCSGFDIEFAVEFWYGRDANPASQAISTQTRKIYFSSNSKVLVFSAPVGDYNTLCLLTPGRIIRQNVTIKA